MGYPDKHFQFIRPTLFAVLVLLLALCIPNLDGNAGTSPERSGLPSGEWDHVIITDQSLKPSFVPLAKHRKSQGLRCRVLSTERVRKWARQDDTMEAVRWFVTTASQQWGTRYVLLGGDSEIIPVPLGQYQSPNYSWEIPLDLYYAAPGGDWDLDGDGILGEFEDDDPDLTPLVALGRAPVSDRTEARAFVNKVINFENQNADDRCDALLAAEVGIPYPWSPGMEIRMDFARETEEVAEFLAGSENIGDIQRLYQNPEAPHYEVPLSAGNFLEELTAGRHRYVGMLARGEAGNWSMGPDMLTPLLVRENEGLDHSFYLAAGIVDCADFRGESVLKTLMTQPGGGCSGALAPSAVTFLFQSNVFFREFWKNLAAGECDRVGDAYRQVLVGQLELGQARPAGNLATLQSMTIAGDPALLFYPTGSREHPGTRAIERKLTAAASPNPFNPITEISFVIPETAGAKVPTGIEIFDLHGRRVARILDDRLAPGNHTVRWFGVDDAGHKVGSGVYFAQIRAGDMRTVEKLVLVE